MTTNQTKILKPAKTSQFRRCDFCKEQLSRNKRIDALYCSRACEQTAYRQRKLEALTTLQNNTLPQRGQVR